MIARASATWRNNLYDELVIDNFAGGGGAGLGIELALGRPTDHAINHDAEAIAMHRVNHPGTEHHHSDVWEVDPLEVTQGRPVGLAWFSPDCKHFSKAKGGKPVSKRVRGLAWVVVKWAKAVRPRVIMLENVEEFQTWGPLTDEGMPCPKRKGDTFRSWKRQLRELGYEVDHRELRARDYGAPTIRKRLFIIARCDGQPIIWPEVTHGDDKEARGSRASSTRTERGSDSDCVPCVQSRGADRALRPASKSSVPRMRGQRELDGHHAARHDQRAKRDEGRGFQLKPYRTAADCIDWSIPCPSIFERKRPLADNTLKRIAAGIKRYVLDNPQPFLVSIANYGGNGAPAYCVDDPLTTITANPKGGHHAVCVPTLVQTGCGERKGQAPRVPGLDKPLGTVVAGGGKHALVAGFLAKHNGKTTGQPFTEPMHTIPTRDRYGLVTVDLDGETYVITDIGMRMLQPRELYRAQGFGEDYIIDYGLDEQGDRMDFTKTAQVRMCGNSVCPPMAEAIVRANMMAEVMA